MTTPRTDNLRAALDRPESKLARAIGKAHFGGTGYYFDAEGWAFLLGAVEAARAALASPSPEPLDELRALSDAATPGPWYVEGPEFGGLWVCAEHGDRQVSGAVHPSRSEQPYAVLAGLGRADSDLIVAAVNYVRARLSEDS